MGLWEHDTVTCRFTALYGTVSLYEVINLSVVLILDLLKFISDHINYDVIKMK